MKTRKIRYLLVLLMTIIALQLNSQNQVSFKIVVNKTTSIESITIEDLKKIFLKKQTKWKNGEKIYPVDLNESSRTREHFTDEVHGKRISAVKAYWQKQIFTGRGVPPPEKSSDKEVLEYVEKNEGAIGYISSGKSIRKYEVKIISIDK